MFQFDASTIDKAWVPIDKEVRSITFQDAEELATAGSPKHKEAHGLHEHGYLIAFPYKRHSIKTRKHILEQFCINEDYT